MAFTEGRIEADGVTFRYLESGSGPALVHLQGADGVRATRAHDVLSGRRRVIAVALPGPGASRVTADLSATLARALTALGVDRFDLWATSEAAAPALRLALEAASRVGALVLEAPAPLPADMEERLPTVTTSTLVTVGTRDDAAAPGRGRVYQDRMPNAHLVLVYDAGPAVAGDRPDAFVEVVGDFLERHEAFVISRAQTVIHP